jgi:hypothetical protein
MSLFISKIEVVLRKTLQYHCNCLYYRVIILNGQSDIKFMKYRFDDLIPLILIILGIIFFIIFPGWKGILLGIFFIIWGLNLK